MKHPHNRERLKEYLDGIVAGKYKQTQVAMWTGYTREHICRLTKRYKKEGSSCLVNGHKGKPGPRIEPAPAIPAQPPPAPPPHTG